MVTLGITGSIGAGKSTATAWFAKKGAVVVEADKVAKEILSTRLDIQRRLKEAFGSGILDTEGRVDFASLAKVAFADAGSQQILNGLIHPPVLENLQQRRELAASRQERLFVVDAPLIFEAGLEQNLDAVIVVVAPLEIRYARVSQRSGLGWEDFKRRDNLQLPQEDKAQRADYVVHNDGDKPHLEHQLEKIFQQLMTRFPELQSGDISR